MLVKQVLRWPEVDCDTRKLPRAASRVYVRYRLKNVALDEPSVAHAYVVDVPKRGNPELHTYLQLPGTGLSTRREVIVPGQVARSCRVMENTF